MTVSIHRHHGELRLGHARPCAVEALCIDNHLHRHRTATKFDGARLKLDDLTDKHRCLEIYAIDRCGHPAMNPVAARFDLSSLIDMGQNDAAEDRALVIGVARHHEHAQRKFRNIHRGKLCSHRSNGTVNSRLLCAVNTNTFDATRHRHHSKLQQRSCE